MKWAEYQVESPTWENEPLGLAAVKKHLRLLPNSNDSDDQELKNMISAAREYCEDITGMAFAAEESVTVFYDDVSGDNVKLELPRSSVLSIDSVLDEDMEEIPYTVNRARGYIVISGKYSQVSVKYTAGMPEIPFAVRQAMLLLIGHWYENRSAVEIGSVASVNIAYTVQDLLKLHRGWWF